MSYTYEYRKPEKFDELDAGQHRYFAFKRTVDMYILSKICNGDYAIKENGITRRLKIRNFILTNEGRTSFLNEIVRTLYEEQTGIEHPIGMSFDDYLILADKYCKANGTNTNKDLYQERIDEIINETAKRYLNRFNSWPEGKRFTMEKQYYGG